MKKTIARNIVIIVSLMLFSFPMGCNMSRQSVTKWDSHEEAMEKLLNQKYGLEFEVGKAEEISGQSPFEETRFLSDVVVCETGKTFTAMISQDNKILHDDYPQTIYEDEIEQRLDSIYSRHPEIVIDESLFQYRKSKDTWDSIEQLDDYLENGPSWISMEISVSEENEEKLAQSLYDFLNDLESNHFQYDIECNYLANDHSEEITFCKFKGDTGFDYAAILDEVRMANQI